MIMVIPPFRNSNRQRVKKTSNQEVRTNISKEVFTAQWRACKSQKK
jgi:hypothetical protein